MNLLSVVEFLAAIAGFIIFTVLVALLCRRALGVPVGWPPSSSSPVRSPVLGSGCCWRCSPGKGLQGRRLVGSTSTAVVPLVIGTILLFGRASIVLVIIEVIVQTCSVGSPFRLLTDTRARARGSGYWPIPMTAGSCPGWPAS